MVSFRSKSEVERLKKIAEGGEANIYDYDMQNVLKLFHSDVNMAVKEQKIKFFVSIVSQLPRNVIAPREEVVVRNKVAGYLMQKLSGSENLHMLVKPKYVVSMKYTNKDLLEVMTKFALDLRSLHAKGILVGDISDYNFQIIGKDNYFIDVDSYGVKNKFRPDAYTEMFTCPDSYRPDNTISFSVENENYNFAVLTFYILTRLHPFGGSYTQKMSPVERMKKKISVLGKHKANITTPKVTLNWNWMSPKLLDDFLQNFEGGKKVDITDSLVDLLNNLTYCKTHNMWYYSKYSECPICNEHAKIKVAPVPVPAKSSPKPGAKMPKLTVLFSDKDCLYLLSSIHYLGKNNTAVHIKTKQNVPISRGTKVDFSNDGTIIYVTSIDTIKIYDAVNNKTISVLERLPKSNYVVSDKTLYYVNKQNGLIKAEVTLTGIMPTLIEKVYKPLFDVSDSGKVFVVSTYPKKMYIHTDTFNFEVKYTGWINEYAIKYDEVTGDWLFVYEMSNGNFRTMVFGKKAVRYDSDVIDYNTMTLENIDFHGSTIFDPSDGKIVGTNLAKGTYKEFKCNVVDENSKLVFTGRGFNIYTEDHIYNFG